MRLTRFLRGLRDGAAMKKPEPPDDRAQNFREDARTYALRGDSMWGHSITWSTPPGESEDGHSGRIVGWLTHHPRPGDALAVRMESGRWGKWLIQKVEPARDPRDMFSADVWGAFGYVDDADVPATAYDGNGLTGVAADLV